MRFPLDQKITTGYSFNQPTFYGLLHEGQDYQATVGTPIYAPEDGVVTRLSGPQIGQGMKLSVGNKYYKFGHLSEWKVYNGVVKEGTLIGLTGGQPGSIGAGTSTAPHLHLAIYIDNIKTDPEKYNWEGDTMSEDQWVALALPEALLFWEAKHHTPNRQEIGAIENQLRQVHQGTLNYSDLLADWAAGN